MGIVSCGDDNEEIEPSPNKESSGKVSGHECVDLGLSVKWATCNVGASSPEEYGNYYAWANNIAETQWGDKWRMPTETELRELCEKCTWTWTTQGGKNGYEVTGPSKNSIFLPAAGYCHYGDVYDQGSLGRYWSSTPFFSLNAYRLYFDSGYQYVDDSDRYGGYSVRAVLAE